MSKKIATFLQFFSNTYHCVEGIFLKEELRMKKVLSFVLVLAMILGSVSLAAERSPFNSHQPYC